MHTLFQDLRYTVRQLRNAPVFSLTAILTLALGIGINAAMFSVVDQVLLRAMPFPRSNEVVRVATRTENGLTAASLPDVLDWQARSHSFSQITPYTLQIPTLGGVSSPKLVPQIVTGPNLFDLLEARPMLGRTFLGSDSHGGNTSVVILSAQVWKTLYHGDAQIVGRAVPINGIPYTVIGVMPFGFSFPANAGDNTIWTPLPLDDKSLQDRGSASLTVMARMRPGVTVAQATQEMNSIHEQLRHEYPKEEDTAPLQIKTYEETLTGSIRPAILALNIAVVAVWLIACANVAGLLLARANGRRREIALRTALGAQRGRLVRQLLTESLVLSLVGGALGLELASLALHLLREYLSSAIVFGDQVHVDARVCFFLLIASCLSAVLFGLLPALQSSRVAPQEGLRQGAAASGTSRGQTRSRDVLVIGEIALTLTLLVAAGLTVRTLVSLRHVHTGFVADQVTTAEIFLPSHSAIAFGGAPPAGPSLTQTFYDPLLERLAAMPGIQSAGFTTVRPLQSGWSFNDEVELANHPKPERAEKDQAQIRGTSAAYFSTMGIRLLQGRLFASSDAASDTPTAIVNRTFVKRFLPNENPIGQRIRYNDKGDRQWATIIGVVDASPQRTLGEPPLPEVHFNLDQLLSTDDLYPVLGAFYMNIAIRSALPDSVIAGDLRRAVHELEPDASLNGIQSMQSVVDDSLGNQVLAARLLGLFSIAGLVIAIAGIYGLLAYTVSQRTRELGVRLALGAQRGSVLWLVLRHAVLLLGIGLAVGAAIVAGSGRVLASFLSLSLTRYDLLVGLAVAAILSLCGLAASYLPARRAAHIDPVVALRSE